jgi:hypothetical protein
MGKPKVIEFLLNHADNALDDMMRMYDGRGMTGFMQACQWNKAKVVELLIGSSIGKSDVYAGFILACQHQQKKTIEIILQSDEFRKHILKEEREKGNAITNPSGRIELRQQILNENQELVISFDAMQCDGQLDIEIKLNSTLNEEEADHLRGPLTSHHQPPGKVRASVGEIESMNLVKNSKVEICLIPLT